jgi:hypothetical protein
VKTAAPRDEHPQRDALGRIHRLQIEQTLQRIGIR